MTGPFPPRVVAPSKITGYLLNPRHEIGSSKEAFFRRHGFSVARADLMAAALAGHPDRNAIEAVTADAWGTRYVVRCAVGTPDGRDPCIRTVWIVRNGEDVARLVTAYPA